MAIRNKRKLLLGIIAVTTLFVLAMCMVVAPRVGKGNLRKVSRKQSGANRSAFGPNNQGTPAPAGLRGQEAVSNAMAEAF